MKKLVKFVIDRTKWSRGEESNNLMHSQKTGKSCCLGLFGEFCGVSKHYMTDKQTPREVNHFLKKSHKKVPSLFRKLLANLTQFNINTNLTNDKMRINDNRFITEIDREFALKKLFRKIGVNLCFKN